MAHHGGMSLLSLVWLLLDKPMQRRFEADPILRAADLLLQERVPKACAPVFPNAPLGELADNRHFKLNENRAGGGWNLRRMSLRNFSGQSLKLSLQVLLNCRVFRLSIEIVRFFRVARKVIHLPLVDGVIVH